MGNFIDNLTSRIPVLSNRSGAKSGFYTSVKTRQIISYESTGVIGKGSFGVVYSAVNEYGQQIAVKSKKVFEDRATMATSDMLFRGELESLFNLEHPNLVNLLGVEFNNGDAYGLVMEFVQGDTLNKVLKFYGALPEITLKSFSRQILAGIAYMHSRNVIHRDLKSSNIMIVGGSMGDSSSTLVGTLPYMAPELMRYDNYDARVDVWSFAVVVYEMATGSPFFTFNGQQILLSQLPTTLNVATLSYYGNNFIQSMLIQPTAAAMFLHPFMY